MQKDDYSYDNKINIDITRTISKVADFEVVFKSIQLLIIIIIIISKMSTMF